MRTLVIDVPALHLGYLGCYGNDWVGTPNIDRLAAAGVVFDRHYFDTDDPFAWTPHGAGAISASSLAHATPTLGQILKEVRLKHAFIPGATGVSMDSLDDVVAQAARALAEALPLTWVRFPSLVPPWNLPADLLDSYCEEDDKPWPNPPHGLLENPDELLRLQNTYAAVVTYVDARIGDMLDMLEERDYLEEMLVCLTAAHGLPLGEHGAIGLVHPWLHEELVHLPLLMRLPGHDRAGLRLDALTQPADLVPTFLEILDIAPPPSAGHGLWPLVREEVNSVRPYAPSALRIGAAGEYALRTLDWAFLLPECCDDESSRQPQLYVKPEDRWEVNDVRQHHLERVDDMTKVLRELAAGMPRG